MIFGASENTDHSLDGITLPKNFEIDTHSEIIIPPAGTYFLRGVKNWTPGEDMTINLPEISCSLQKDGQTIPIRPFGYILEIDKGGIVSAYDRDITSEVGEHNLKEPSKRASRNDLKNYSENNLDGLIENTKKGFHNELIVRGDKVSAVEAYMLEGTSNLPGIKQFKKDCLAKGIEIHIIPNISEPKILDVGEAVQMAILTADAVKDTDQAALGKDTYRLALDVWKGLTGKEPQGALTQEYLTDDIFTVLQKATSIKPEDRYATPAEFAKALKTAAFPQPRVDL